VTVRNPSSFTTLNIDDAGNAVGRNASHSLNLATGVATISGLAPAIIDYRAGEVNSLNVILGSGDDTYRLGAGAQIPGFLWDVGGNATLDYSAYTTGVYVNLATAEATSIAGGVYGIPYVIGGAGDDYLHGDARDNWLVGNGGHDILVGDEGGDWLQGG